MTAEKMEKRIIFISSLTFVLLVIGISVIFNNSSFTRKEKRIGDNYSYKIEKHTLEIWGKGKMPRKMSFENDKSINKLIIHDGVRSINAYAFENCSNLKSVVIGEGVEEIGDLAFTGTSIKKVVLPSTVKKIGYRAFNGIGKEGWLEEITIPGDISFFTIQKSQTGWDFPEDMAMINAKKVKVYGEIDFSTFDYIHGGEYEVINNDKYNSYEGAIYSNDYKTLYMLPNVKEYKIKEGTEIFDLHAIRCGDYGDTTAFASNEKLRQIDFPKTVNKFIDSTVSSEDNLCLNHFEKQGLELHFKEATIKKEELEKIPGTLIIVRE